MANTVDITRIMEGERHAVFHVFLKSDGASGDLSDFTLIDPAVDLNPTLSQSPNLTIEQLWYDMAGFDARLSFSYLLEGTGVWVMSGGQGHHIDFNHFGGLKDRSGALDGTGKLMITTSGFTSAGDFGSIVIKVRKD